MTWILDFATKTYRLVEEIDFGTIFASDPDFRPESIEWCKDGF